MATNGTRVVAETWQNNASSTPRAAWLGTALAALLGDDRARNAAWLKITTVYIKSALIAAYLLRLWPPALRPTVPWILPPRHKPRSQIAEACRILVGVIEARGAAKGGREGWRLAGRPPSTAKPWRGLSKTDRSAISPSSRSSSWARRRLRPRQRSWHGRCWTVRSTEKIAEPLRREITQVIREGGWKKASLHDMKAGGRRVEGKVAPEAMNWLSISWLRTGPRFRGAICCSSTTGRLHRLQLIRRPDPSRSGSCSR